MDEELEIALKNAVLTKASIDEVAAILRDYRDHGTTSDTAVTALERLRQQCGEESEDRILEILDIVSGFCKPELRVWHDR